MHKLLVAITASFFLFIIWIIYLANTGQSSVFFDLVRQIPYGDKLGHFSLFGLLTLSFNVACKFKTFVLGELKVFWGSAVVLVFVSAEELSQHFMPSRTLDIYDYAANVTGIIVFSWLSSVMARRTST
ncbi:VanZ family protein [Paraferrimonas haliotis]|uniref:Trypsin n=1 Tax=Paraferrimonas haliotis TaxID=2013866 RepID=A0AA37TMT7_9GAMM|nr:VanZ family protein [Paraferrimonas haliotis]GLS84554.1 hypothetical protein GCM10007894_25310 [Paraferrimonas haliotis]